MTTRPRQPRPSSRPGPVEDFDAERQKRQAAYQPVEFTLGGQRFECVKALPSLLLFDAVDASYQSTDLAESYKVNVGLIEAALASPDDVARLHALLADRKAAIEMHDVGAVAVRLFGWYSNPSTRPEPPKPRTRK